MIEAVIWDMDGVVLDSERTHALIESKVAAEFGIELSPEEIIKRYSGLKIEREFKDMSRTFKKDMPLERALEIRKRLLTQQIEEIGIPAVPFAKEVLTELGQRYPMALASSTERIFGQRALDKLGLFKLFRVSVFGDEVTNSKPDPKIFLEAAKLINVNSSGIIVVEDSQNGFRAAKAAGMLLVARRAEHNMNTDFSLADYVVEDLREIPRLLKVPSH